MPTSNTEEPGRFLKCTVIGRGVFGPCACCPLYLGYPQFLAVESFKSMLSLDDRSNKSGSTPVR